MGSPSKPEFMQTLFLQRKSIVNVFIFETIFGRFIECSSTFIKVGKLICILRNTQTYKLWYFHQQNDNIIQKTNLL